MVVVVDHKRGWLVVVGCLVMVDRRKGFHPKVLKHLRFGKEFRFRFGDNGVRQVSDWIAGSN